MRKFYAFCGVLAAVAFMFSVVSARAEESKGGGKADSKVEKVEKKKSCCKEKKKCKRKDGKCTDKDCKDCNDKKCEKCESGKDCGKHCKNEKHGHDSDDKDSDDKKE